MPAEKIRDYDVIEGPFSGTYGSVKIGCHAVLGTRRAIKQLHDHVKPAIIRDEALKQQNIKSPYVVQIYDFFEDENAIVMEYCPLGLDTYLGKRLRQVSGKIPFEEAREILHGILQGLNDAHAAGVIHGDIKPANVRFGAGEAKDDIGLPKLSDFGAARKVREDVPGIRGSTNWMAPEVIEGAAPTEESDYFSFGILAYLMLCGRHPYYADDPSCLLSEEDNITDPTFRPVSLSSLRDDVPVLVADLVMELLSRDPASRIPAASELKAALSHPPEITPEPPAAAPTTTAQPSQEDIAHLTSTYNTAKEWFFVRYRSLEAVQILEAFLEQFDWQRFRGSRVTILADCWSLRAFINNSAGLYGQAVIAATNGLGIDPDHVNSFQARAYAKTQLGAYPEALEDLQHALTLPASPVKRRQLSQLLDTVRDRMGGQNQCLATTE